MPLPKLTLLPSQEGYSVEIGDAVLRARPGSGQSRQRLDMLGAPHIVSVSFALDRLRHAYWRAFFRTTIVEGSLPFLIDLIIDGGTLAEYEAKIVPGSVAMSGVRGLTHFVQAQLEVKATVADALADAGLVTMFEIYDADASAILDLLAHLVLVDLPTEP